MTTAKKLYLGFGILLALWALTMITLSIWLTDLRQELQTTLWLILITGLVLGVVTSGVVGNMIVQAEKAIHDEREWFTIALASIGDAVIVFDAQERVTFLNAIARNLTGWQDEALGQPLSVVFRVLDETTRSSQDKLIDCINRPGQAGKLPCPLLLVSKNGEEVPIEEGAATLSDHRGNIRGKVLTFRDVSEVRRTERRRNARLAITQTLVHSATREQAIGAILKAMGEALSWDAGAIWLVEDRASVLRCFEFWSQPSAQVAKFEALTRETALAAGVGLPGRVWSSGEPAWIIDIAQDGNFPRAPMAAQEGLRGAFAFPILVGQHVMGVVEFFSKTNRMPDDDQVEMAKTLGNQLGLFLEGKQAEETLKNNERELTDFFDNAPIGLHWVNPEGIIIRANRNEMELRGYRPDEYIGHSLTEFFVDQEVAADKLRRLKAGEILHNYPARVRYKNGSIRHVIIDSSAYWRDGQFMHTCCFSRDVTDRKLAEEAFTESEKRFQTLADRAPVLIWMANPDKVFFFFNQTWLDFTGRKLAQELDNGWIAGIHPADQESFQTAYASAVETREKFDMEFRLHRRDGEYRWMFVTGVPRFLNGEEFVGYIGTCFDITDRKQAEDAKQEALESLAEADRRKDEFLAILSHELRNPLAPIRNALHLLHQSRLDSPDLAEAGSIIERQVHQLSGIVDDLLDVFRITHRKLKLRKESVDLVNVVRLTAEDHRSALEGIRLKLNTELPNKPVWVMGDRTRLVQVLSNLLYNAAKFTNPGDEVAVRVQSDPVQQRVFVSVRDTGIGIAPHMLTRIFDHFSQGERNHDRNQGGLGLGLALVKGLVELHGGQVSARSEGEGRGVEISFWLPLGVAPKFSPPSRDSTPVERPLRILIVEDNRDTAKTLQMLLARHGHEVRMTHTGNDGLDAARSWHPEVMLCDLGLPGMDGFELARAVRHDPTTADSRLIAISGYGQDEDRKHSEEAGFDLHLTKPVDPLDLLRLLAVLKVGS